MVATQQHSFPWYERVFPPDHPEKTEHVRNYWRRKRRRTIVRIVLNGDVGRAPATTGVDPRVKAN